MAKKQPRGAKEKVAKRQATTEKNRTKSDLKSSPDSPGYFVHGHVYYFDESPASGLQVIAFDKDVSGETPLGDCTVDDRGCFRVAYTAAQFRRTKNERRGADIFVRVFDKNDSLLLQSKTVNNAPKALELNVTLPAKSYLVRGQIRLADGGPCVGATVRAFDRDLRSREPLGKSKVVVTDRDGKYEIVYTAEQFSWEEKGSADLLVEVREANATKWTAAPIRFNAQPAEIVDFTLGGVYRGPSEFDRLVAALTPLLDGITLAQLTENSEHQDFTFLTNETGLDRQQIEWLAASARRAEEQNLLRHEEYYGLFRQALPTDLETLFKQDTNKLRAALRISSRDNIVRPMRESELDAFVTRVLKLKAEDTLRPGAENEPASLGDWLHGAIDSKQQAVVAQHFLQNDGATDAFWKALDNDAAIGPNDKQAVKQALALADLTSNHLPLIRELQRLAKDTNEFADLRTLAKWDEQEWKSLLLRRAPDSNEPIGFPPTEQSVDSYARTLSGFIAKAFPTAVIADRIGRDGTGESPFKSTKNDLGTFFANNPEFSFGAMPLIQYLSDGASQKLRDVEDSAALTQQLLNMQRVLNVVPDYAAMRAMLADDLHSATAMVHLGERRYIERYAEFLGGAEPARDAYARAERTHATALNVYLKRSNAFNSPNPYVISGNDNNRSANASSGSGSMLSSGSHTTRMTPDYSSLFGSLDLCECQHCLSLYSPAAYFVDILKFLENGPIKDGQNPLQVLLNLRPDLEHIELTCENTNTQLPYVDLTNEILESRVAERSFEIAEGQSIAADLAALNQLGIPNRLKLGFSNNGYPLSEQASVRIDRTAGEVVPSTWIVIDKAWAFTLRHMGTNEGFKVFAWPQTSWTSNELRANPEHIEDQAYSALRTAIYPWNLPLNMPLQEMRGYFAHLGASRHEVMETFLSDAAAVPVSDEKISLEYLGLSTEEADVITGVTTGGPTGPRGPSGPWDFWGLRENGNDVVDRANGSAPRASGDWDVVLQRVSIFLQQSGLTYQELLELLGTYFVNPTASVGTPGGRLLGIASTDYSDAATCNLGKLEIKVFDATVADKKAALKSAWNRLHRFVRLSRKLGWTLRDLDKVMSAQPSNVNGAIDFNALLITLSHLQRLYVATELPIVTLLAWFAKIDSVEYIDHLTDDEPRVPSLFAQLFSNNQVTGQFVGDNPAALTGLLTDKSAAIAAALQLSVDDLNRLRSLVPNNSLSLDNLSLLYRHASLASALSLSVRDYLIALELVDASPFATTERTLQFKERIEAIRSSGFDLETLNYLLRDRLSAGSELGLAEETIGTALDALRDDLRKIAADNTYVDAGIDDAATADANGDLTRKKLALLNWDTSLIERAIAVFNDTCIYSTPLAALPANLAIPDSLKDALTYDATDTLLRFAGTMSQDQRDELAGLANASSAFIDAIDRLLDAPKDFVARHMARFSTPDFVVAINDATLKSLLAQLKFPDVLKSKIYYDSVASKLHFAGVMTDNERSILAKLSTNAAYDAAIGVLFDSPMQPANAPVNADIFLTATGTGSDVALLFGNPNAKPEARFLLILKKLLPRLRASLSEIAVKQRVAEYLTFDATTIDGLLKQWLKPRAVDALRPERRAMADFLDSAFAESSPSIRPSKEAFPTQFDSYRLLHKISLIVSRFKITSRQLQWLFDPRLNANWPDLNALPVTSTANATPFFKWLRLTDLFRLRDSFRRGENVLSGVFAASVAPGAQLDPLLVALSAATQWDLSSLRSLCGPAGFNCSVADFAGEATLVRLARAFSILKRIGASGDQCLPWARLEPTGEHARELKSVVRAKYDDAQWLEVAKSLRDPLRERQRSALVSYLVQALDARDSADLHDRLLIDVEMCACMMTTRIKQAINSVQLFIQRSLMNLESEVALTSKEAKEWTQWRKWYRVWEANRKVLFYPENWIEPELRDDKSPFFTDLENELLQGEVTADSAEDALLHYLEKLAQVARLEIVGIYRQQEPEDILHVFGRTYADPHGYFYRRLQNKVWTPWEKIDLDIEGNHLLPVVWNRRIYLFWAIFTEKSEQPTKQQRIDNDDPRKYWEIKFAWSEYRNKRWSAKKISKDFLRHDWNPTPNTPQEIQDYSFKTRVRQGNGGEYLSIECYGTTVTEIPPKTITVSSSTTTTVNTQKIVSYFKDNDQANYWYWLKFAKDGWKPLHPAEIDDIKILMRSSRTGALFETIKLDNSGQYPSFGNFATITEPVDFFLESTTKQIMLVTDKWWFIGGLGVSIDLMDWSPTTNTTTTTQQVPGGTINNLMRGLGEFILDDRDGHLALVRGPLAVSPASLEPISGTQFKNMMMVDLNQFEAMGKGAVLAKTPGTFRLLGSHRSEDYTATYISLPFFYQDERHTYAALRLPSGKVQFSTFYHPKVGDFIKALNRVGIAGLLTLENQRFTDNGTVFRQYLPDTSKVDLDLPQEEIDFSHGGVYAGYNWEVFFHAPFMIAVQLSKNQRFEEAQKWFHYIFDPTSTDSPDNIVNPGPERFWRVKPFYEAAMHGTQTLEALLAETAEIESQVSVWQANPFKPHVIARMRVVAYMKAVVMRYIDNLVEWGDQLFRRDTIESINEATQLYMLAGRILGRRPESVPARAQTKVQTPRTLDDLGALDTLSNSIVEIESFLAPAVAPSPPAGADDPPPLRMQYFCITGNDKLLGYWDTVADRLFKIRHCMNIEGVERALAIFEPPIDPALLVRAAAAGVDIASALNDLNAALPHYRFTVMLQKAVELCSDVKGLGASFLTALEKQDAEHLALLRSNHEVELLKAMRAVKEQQVQESSNAWLGLLKYQDVVTARQQYYQTRPFINTLELGHLALAQSSLLPMTAQLGAELIAAVLHLVPNAKAAAPTSVGVTYGGENIASAVQAYGSAAGTTASMLNTMGSLSSTLGGYQRRQDDWHHQAELATKELKQVEKQIAAAEIRLAISELELKNQDLQIENTKNVDEYMRSQKFNNRDLYSWMVGQLAGIYFQSYRLAYDVAKRAERTYRHELGLRDSNFVQFGYWDSLKKGLLSGERLHQDLRRMDVAYLDQNKREFEITKHISLLSIDPLNLIKLKETGECFVTLPEALFDIDYPGHYMRRIKSVSISIPCVTGPYSSVNCTLTQLNSSIRHANTLLSGRYVRRGDDGRFADNFGSIQSIVTSSGQNDPGLFDANLHDERYLPFEGLGVIGTWRLQMPTAFPRFDHETIADVILHIRYTARDGGDALKDRVQTELRTALTAIANSGSNTGFARSFSLKQEFPSEWYRLIANAATADSSAVEFAIPKDRFPFLFSSSNVTLTIVRANLYAMPTQSATDRTFPDSLTIKSPTGAGLALNSGAAIGSLSSKTFKATIVVSPNAATSKWTFAVASDLQDFRKNIDDIVMVCHFTVAATP